MLLPSRVYTLESKGSAATISIANLLFLVTSGPGVARLRPTVPTCQPGRVQFAQKILQFSDALACRELGLLRNTAAANTTERFRSTRSVNESARPHRYRFFYCPAVSITSLTEISFRLNSFVAVFRFPTRVCPSRLLQGWSGFDHRNTLGLRRQASTASTATAIRVTTQLRQIIEDYRMSDDSVRRELRYAMADLGVATSDPRAQTCARSAHSAQNDASVLSAKSPPVKRRA